MEDKRIGEEGKGRKGEGEYKEFRYVR